MERQELDRRDSTRREPNKGLSRPHDVNSFSYALSAAQEIAPWILAASKHFGKWLDKVLKAIDRGTNSTW